jgi:hypothetical protein
MNLFLKPLAIIGLSALFIAGCGSSNAVDSTDEKAPAAAPAEKQKAEGTETSAQEKTETTDEAGIIRILEQNIQYTVNGEPKEQTAFLKHSDNQDYSMYVLPDYQLTAEEPYKDTLFWSEDDSIFMRIELLPGDAEWKLLQENTEAQLAAVNPEVREVKVPEDPFFKDAWAMETKAGTEIVTSYLIKNEDQLLKLTLFTKENADHKEAFLKMGKSILKEKN